MWHLEIERPGEQLGQPGPRESDLDPIGSDFHAAEEGHEHRLEFIGRRASEFFRDLPATFDVLAPPRPAL